MTDCFLPVVGLREWVPLATSCSGSHRCSRSAGVDFGEYHCRRGSFWYSGRVYRSYEVRLPRIYLKFANLDLSLFLKTETRWVVPRHRHRQTRHDSSLAKRNQVNSHIAESTQIPSCHQETRKLLIYTTKYTRRLAMIIAVLLEMSWQHSPKFGNCAEYVVYKIYRKDTTRETA